MKKALIMLLGFMISSTTPVLAGDLPLIDVTISDPVLGTKTFTGCFESGDKKFCPRKLTRLFNSCEAKGGWYVKAGSDGMTKTCLIQSTRIYPKGYVGGDPSVFLLVVPQDN
jgi:hypothetical protein